MVDLMGIHYCNAWLFRPVNLLWNLCTSIVIKFAGFNESSSFHHLILLSVTAYRTLYLSMRTNYWRSLVVHKHLVSIRVCLRILCNGLKRLHYNVTTYCGLKFMELIRWWGISCGVPTSLSPVQLFSPPLCFTFIIKIWR